MRLCTFSVPFSVFQLHKQLSGPSLWPPGVLGSPVPQAFNSAPKPSKLAASLSVLQVGLYDLQHKHISSRAAPPLSYPAFCLTAGVISSNNSNLLQVKCLDGLQHMHIPAGQQYQSPGEAYVEGDASSASYFLAGEILQPATLVLDECRLWPGIEVTHGPAP